MVKEIKVAILPGVDKISSGLGSRAQEMMETTVRASMGKSVILIKNSMERFLKILTANRTK